MDSREINVDDATVRTDTSGQAEDDGPESETELENEQTVITTGNPSSVPAQPPGVGTPAEVARVLLGHRLDHFFLETLVGGGGMGAVFRARDTRLDRTVAIKVIPRVGEDAELQRRFRNEAQSAARLDHPNIARVYDVGQHGGWYYIVFEYIDGTNLRDLVQRDGVLSVDDAVYYTRQVAEALDHAHRRGIVHRDIKPSNVLITTDGQAKLVDMGLARAQQLEMADDMTASGVTLGTFDYISPEQARDPRDADVRSDIYSLGCTLYFALTGSAPYPSGTVLQKLLSHGSSPPPDPRRVRNDLSKSLVAVLHRMLAKEPGNRYRKPLDLISDLYLLASRDSLPRSLAAGSITVAPPSKFAKLVERHLPWMLAVSVLLASAALLQIVAANNDDLELPTPPPAVVKSTGVVAPMSQANQSDLVERPPVPIKNENPVGKPITVRIMGTESLLGGTIDSANRLLVNSMVEAIEAANNDAGIAAIEIDDATVRCGPLSLPTRAITFRGLTANSKIQFQTNQAASARESSESVDLIKLGNFDVRFESLKLDWNCESSLGGSIFLLSSNSRLRMSRCVVTIDLIETAGPATDDARSPQVLTQTLPTLFAFEAQENEGRRTGGPTSTNPADPELLEIELNNCIIRGEMTMLDLRDPTSVNFRWNNGLLAVSGSMLKSVGVRLPIPFLMAADNSRIQMVINDVTAATGNALLTVVCKENTQPIMVDRVANRSVFVAENSQPIVSLLGIASGYDPSRGLAMRGRDNQYYATGETKLVVLREALTMGAVRQTDPAQLGVAEPPRWFAESNAGWSVEWKNSSVPRGPFIQRIPADYSQVGMLAPGFRAEELPRLEVYKGTPNPGGI